MFIIRMIIALNIIVFLAWHLPMGFNTPSFMANNFLISWDALVEGRYWALIGSAFSHNMFLHIFINMYVLYSFGGVVLRTIGINRFLKFYFVAAIFSSFCHAAVSAFILNEPHLPALGASGAIAGLILLFSLMYPKERILLLGIIPMPAIVGALAFVGLDIWGLVAQAGGHGLPIGHGAHLGGAIAGIIYYINLRRRMRTLYV
jgi:membrane associated rhomboid family serine protease